MATIFGQTNVGHSRGQPHNHPKHRVPTSFSPHEGTGPRVRPSKTRVLGVMGGRLGATASGNSRGSKSRGAPRFPSSAVMPVQTRPHGAQRANEANTRVTPARFGKRRLSSTRSFLRGQLPNS